MFNAKTYSGGEIIGFTCKYNITRGLRNFQFSWFYQIGQLIPKKYYLYIVATLSRWILRLLVMAMRAFLIKRRIRNIKFVGICWTNNIIVTAARLFRRFNNWCAPHCLLGVIIRFAFQYLCHRYYFTGRNKYLGPSYNVSHTHTPASII